MVRQRYDSFPKSRTREQCRSVACSEEAIERMELRSSADRRPFVVVNRDCVVIHICVDNSARVSEAVALPNNKLGKSNGVWTLRRAYRGKCATEKLNDFNANSRGGGVVLRPGNLYCTVQERCGFFVGEAESRS